MTQAPQSRKPPMMYHISTHPSIHLIESSSSRMQVSVAKRARARPKQSKAKQSTVTVLSHIPHAYLPNIEQSSTYVYVCTFLGEGVPGILFIGWVACSVFNDLLGTKIVRWMWIVRVYLKNGK
ncbi:hypothetical protein BO85DRAFT_433960 [Aspergillus piperis CBS 112811]|uniref:Uncharacterized protein n=1 Tax=Aspergillus piperis CBS 112811 TaxID=1448313 RepID=A0A8G1RE69_9EURO|nr:hypothetical protein BO85DRAFT_433960 [Aspergillus piperis CBS 112811]RAH63447.1 hypothetical protein BO85DRAFT_433960 [Aspergillus piperis CBS 112811]